ncbi:MAG: TolC family outer membrane protein [Alphaproteobacteria bacterium]|jgi:TolC family type I secretion outer membrane protein|nr:TolC family outer membrane protein [Alphaproteobacteria bacterium]
MTKATRRGTSRIGRRLGALAAVLTGILALSGPVGAETLEDALVITYQTSPVLASELESLRSTNEQVPQALAGHRPFAQATGSAGVEREETEPGDSEVINPASIGITVLQPVYRGGRTEADVETAEFTIQSARAQFYSVEQNTLLDAVTAYMNVVRSQAVLELQINNEDVLRRQLEAAQDRFAVGEVTRTDVSQAEARLAAATAGRIQAAGTLRDARAVYEQVVGQAPGTLEAAPPPLQSLPGSLDEAVAVAEDRNPVVIGAVFNERAALANVESIRGELLPELNVRGEVRYDRDISAFTEERTSASVLAEVTVPLYQSGSVSSRVREARYVAAQRRIQVEDARRSVIQNTISAWEALVTARAEIDARLAEVASASIALDGVQQEALVGSRTTLDVLDAEQELLDARVSLVTAQRDEVVAGYEVLAAMGLLTARELGLPVDYYDIDRDYEETRGRFWGTSIID